jgi:hypothetical protein
MMFNFCSAKANTRPATSKPYAEPQRCILRTSADVPGIGALDALSETDHKGSAWAACRDFVGSLLSSCESFVFCSGLWAEPFQPLRPRF